MYLTYQPITLQENDKFIPYHRRTKQKALHGGVCEVKKDKTISGSQSDAIQYAKNGKWYAVLAEDSLGCRRIFRQDAGWGFLKR